MKWAALRHIYERYIYIYKEEMESRERAQSREQSSSRQAKCPGHLFPQPKFSLPPSLGTQYMVGKGGKGLSAMGSGHCKQRCIIIEGNSRERGKNR